MHWLCRDRRLELDRPVVMGVLNVTPDSFSDGGKYAATEAAIAHGIAMLSEGAAIIDVGGESTRPGAEPVPESIELERILPVIERLSREPALISVDTSKPAVMRAALAAGAHIVNDVMALRSVGARQCAADLGAGVCLMHMQGVPRSMQRAPTYRDVVAEVLGFLTEQREACLAAGIGRERIAIDPGFGFGKTVDHNLTLLQALAQFAALEAPLIVGLSRKSLIGRLVGDADADRLAGGLGLAAYAAVRGARIIRTHDVKPTRQALDCVAAALQGSLLPTQDSQ
jgi:dihydropteroate synthase